ncbi:MAG: hypothetical protein IPK16_01640 [Anaerolineales bacterium]|nr:hypothetical protein [Anaerolineales bacterium]
MTDLQLPGIEVTFLVENAAVGSALADAMDAYLPQVHYSVLQLENPQSIPLIQILCDAQNAKPTSKIVMPIAGRCSRMEQLLAGNQLPHKALIPVAGSPLFVHALACHAATLVPAYPGFSWVLNPDTIATWDDMPLATSTTDLALLTPLPAEYVRLLKGTDYQVHTLPGSKLNGQAPDGPSGIGGFIARCFLASRTGGYSVPSVLGIKKGLLQSSRADLALGDLGIRDFWAYCSAALDIPGCYAAGKAATIASRAWFDVDTPAALKTLYDGVPSGLWQESGNLLNVNWGDTPHGLAQAKFVESASLDSSLTIDRQNAQRISFRHCVFDHAELRFELDPNLPHAVIDGLVVANCSGTIRIGAPVVRDVMVHGLQIDQVQVLTLSLDSQVCAAGCGGAPSAAPLMLRDLAVRGFNEVLRCPVTVYAGLTNPPSTVQGEP